MNARRCMLAAAMGFLVLWTVCSQGADPKTVTPAWVMEKQFTQPEATKPTNAFDVFFIGYDYPTLSGSLASYLTSWNGPVNFSIGFESGTGQGSSFLTGVEGEFFVTINNKGSRLLMNDMLMLGYTLDLAPVRLNLGGRLGLSILDVMDDSSSANTYTGIGLVAGPEASVYLAFDPAAWLWIRGRYSLAYYMSMDTSTTNPIALGNDSLNCLSLEAGLAFKM